MQLIRTTLRLPQQVMKVAQRMALEKNTTFQALVHRALEEYFTKAFRRKARRIVFHTHNLGAALDNLTRDDYYPDPTRHAD